jgi:hypothetical protein
MGRFVHVGALCARRKARFIKSEVSIHADPPYASQPTVCKE